MDVKIASNGRLILPRQAREAMDLSVDAKVPPVIDDDVACLVPLSHRVRHAREMSREAITASRTTDDFLQERHEEAGSEESEVMAVSTCTTREART